MNNKLFLTGVKIIAKKWRLAQRRNGSGFEYQEAKLQGFIAALNAINEASAFFRGLEEFVPELAELERFHMEAETQKMNDYELREYIFDNSLVQNW